MKDFCKWLGVSDKIARLIIWLFIGMCFLIVTNVMLESVGLPYYKITVENLSKIDYSKLLDYIFSQIIVLFDFYSLIYLVFRIKEFKNIFPYSIIYLLLNILIFNLFGNISVQIFIPIFAMIFCYLYANKNWKYIIYGFGSYLIGIFIQYFCYLYKLRFINYETMNELNKLLTSIDFFIIMFIIILIKEIILRKKEENKNGTK